MTRRRTLAVRIARARRQREIRRRNTLAERCINDTVDGSHGSATHGVRCATCAVTHRRSR